MNKYSNKMGLTKTENFTAEQNSISTVSKVLGHPARIAILQYLAQQQSCICGDLVDEIGLAQPTISQHLKELKRIGIIKGTIEGTSVCYCIDITKWNQLKNTFNTFFGSIDACNEECC